MFETGKKKEVIIKVLPRTQTSTGMFGTSEYTIEYDRLDIWADKGHLDTLKNTQGVMDSGVQGGNPIHYYVFVDPRYDTNWVVKEIEANLQIRKPKAYKKKKENTLTGSGWTTIDF